MARIKVRGRAAVYHCISRIVGGQLLLEDFRKEQFRRMMWRHARFRSLRIVTCRIMSNHVHLLVRVPEEPEVPDRKLLARAEALYGRKGAIVVLLRQALEQKGSLDPDLLCRT